MSDEILVSDEGAVRSLTMNRPDKLNAMNAALVNQLTEALQSADTDPDIRAVVLKGAGRAFSAGADIRATDGGTPLESSSRTLRLYQTLIGGSTPIIAAVHGYALGGGCNVAVSADLVVAGESALFGYPEVKIGLAATAVSPPLVHQIGRKAAFELLTLCENVGPDRALELGMINHVVPDAELGARAMAIAQQLAGFEPLAVSLTKETIRRAADLSLPDALTMARDHSLAMHLGGDAFGKE
ncbi:MAG: enoyl-CoA hydratase/isomerase family protein [Pseudomonadota bacterium]